MIGMKKAAAALGAMAAMALGSSGRYAPSVFNPFDTPSRPFRRRSPYPGFCAGEKEKARRVKQVMDGRLDMAGAGELFTAELSRGYFTRAA